MASNADTKRLLPPSTSSDALRTFGSGAGFSFGSGYGSAFGSGGGFGSSGVFSSSLSSSLGSASSSFGGSSEALDSPLSVGKLYGMMDDDCGYISASRYKSKSGNYDSISIHKGGSSSSSRDVSREVQDSVKAMQDSVASAHQRLKYTGDQLNLVQQRITHICADGNNLSERVAKSGAEVAKTQKELNKVNKEMVRMQDRFGAEINLLKENTEKMLKLLEKQPYDDIARIKSLEKQASDLSTRIQSLENQISDDGSRIKSLEKQSIIDSTRIKVLEKKSSDDNARIKSLEDAQSSLMQELSAYSARVKRLEVVLVQFEEL